MNFLSTDGFINVEEYINLAREIDKFAAKEGLKPTTIYFTPKIVPKFDRVKAKAGGDAWTKKRAQVVKTKVRQPAAGSRMRMVVQLRLYKGIEDPEYGFNKDIAAAIKALTQHNKLAERVVGQFKKEGAKLRERAAKDFDKNLDCFMTSVLDNADGVDYAIGTSMMGKTLVVKLPNGGYVSVGKSDADKFKRARESEAEVAPTTAAKKKVLASKKKPAPATVKTAARKKTTAAVRAR